MESTRKYRYLYYLSGGLPLLLIYLFMSLMDIELLNRLIFSLAFLWNFTLKTPEIDKRIDHPKYRFSFLRVMKTITNFYLKLPEKFLRFDRVLRNIAPLLALYFLLYFSETGFNLYPLIGLLLFEIFYFYFQKFSLRMLSKF